METDLNPWPRALSTLALALDVSDGLPVWFGRVEGVRIRVRSELDDDGTVRVAVAASGARPEQADLVVVPRAALLGADAALCTGDGVRRRARPAQRWRGRLER